MDVGNPSNFARMMDMYRNDVDAVRNDIQAYSYTDHETENAIKEIFTTYNYLVCPHTAVGYLGMRQFLTENHIEKANAVTLATAHPVKFGETVEPLIGQPVEIPQRLKDVLGTEKRSIPMRADFSSFKQWLLGS